MIKDKEDIRTDIKRLIERFQALPNTYEYSYKV